MIIRTISNLQELETVQSLWKLWQNHPNTDFDHFKLICQLRQESVLPHILVVEYEGQPLALLVGRLEHTHFDLCIGYFKPARIPAKVLTILYNGLIGESNEDVTKALVQHLLSFLASDKVDAVVFHHLSEHLPLLQALFVDGSRFYCEKQPRWSDHWAMVLPENFNFLQQVGNKQRWKIRKRLKELEVTFQGKISWHWMNHFDDVYDICNLLEEVAASTYQRALGSGFVNDEEHRLRFTLLNSSGQLRMQLLKIDGKIQAFWIGVVYKDVFYSQETGYNPNLRQHEVGTLVFMRMANELAQEGVRRLDFGLGDALYKQRFGDECWRETTVRMFAPTSKGVALRISLGFFHMLDGFGRYLLRKAGAINQLKTLWRRRLSSVRSESYDK